MNKTLKELFEVRDALQTLVNHGYKLEDMLDAVNTEISAAVAEAHNVSNSRND